MIFVMVPIVAQFISHNIRPVKVAREQIFLLLESRNILEQLSLTAEESVVLGAGEKASICRSVKKDRRLSENQDQNQTIRWTGSTVGRTTGRPDGMSY